MIRMSTRHTHEFALRLTVGFFHVTARATSLACVGRIDTCHRLEFVATVLVEPAVRTIEHRSVQSCLCLNILARVLYCTVRRCRHVLQL